VDAEHEPGRGAGRSLEDEQWEAARKRTREEVHSIFASSDEVALRRCPRCGVEERTRWENCPHCGWSYFRKPPRFSDRTKRVAAVVAIAAAAFGLSQLIPALLSGGKHEHERAAARSRAFVAAEEKRLRKEQAPHFGSAKSLKPPANAHAPAVRKARRTLVVFAENAITADAKGRIARGELEGPVVRTECGPLGPVNRGQHPTPDDQILTKPIGRYDCTAIKRDVVQDGKTVAVFGYPFVAAVDFRTFTFTWCKNNPAQGERGVGLAFVRLSRQCLAARGRPFGNGYLVVPDTPIKAPPP
jgi:predicted  nucleic acid-binding Zn-ribbon protein